MMTTPYQTTKRAHSVAKSTRQACRASVERTSAFFAADANGCANEIAFADLIVSAQSGVADKKKRARFFVPADQAMQNQPVVDLVEEDGSASNVFRLKRANLHRFSVADRRGHALAARSEVDRSSLAQKCDQSFLYVGERSFARLVFSTHGQQSYMEKVQTS